MKKNFITQALLLGSSVAFLAGCGEKAEQTEVAASAALSSWPVLQELVRGNGTEVASLDPYKVQGIPEAHILRDLMEGLVIQDAEGNTIPGTAESWETTDNKRFVFTIRKDAKWSNGEDLTAQDFEYAFKRLADANTASPYSWYLEKAHILNAKDIIAGNKPAAELGIKALNDKTLEIQTEIPLPYFIKMLTHTSLYPVHKATVEKFGDDWTKPENYVSNGAYKLSNWVVNERIELVRNAQYWDNADTVINKVTYLPIENQNAEMNRFLSGEIHMTSEVPNEQFKRLKKEYPNEVAVTPNLCTYFYGFNNSKPPFNDVRVRKAISYLIDRDVVANALLGQGQLPAYSLTHSGTAGFKAELPEYAKMTQQERNEAAKALIMESGYSAQNLLEFTLLYNTSENHKKIAVAIQSMWDRALGDMVDVTLENQEWKTYLDTRRQGNYHVTRTGWCADYNEASAFLAIAMTDNGNNDSRYSSTVFDEAMLNAANAKTDEERAAFYVQAEAQLAKDMAIAPIYEYVQTRLLSTKVAGYPYKNAEDSIYTKDLSLKN